MTRELGALGRFAATKVAYVATRVATLFARAAVIFGACRGRFHGVFHAALWGQTLIKLGRIFALAGFRAIDALGVVSPDRQAALGIVAGFVAGFVVTNGTTRQKDRFLGPGRPVLRGRD